MQEKAKFIAESPLFLHSSSLLKKDKKEDYLMVHAHPSLSEIILAAALFLL